MKTRVLTTMVVGGLLLGGSACGGGHKTAEKAAPPPAAGTPAPSGRPAPGGTPASGGTPSKTPARADKPFGPGCAAMTNGKDGFAVMAAEPVTTAATHNPALSTLVDAVSKAGLTDRLNAARNLTVFTPTNDAFKRLPKATLKKILKDDRTLAGVLTYHAVARKLTPADLAKGTFKTVEGATLTTHGSGGSYTVGGAHVVCGNVHTANATVYVIDTVLMPPKR